VLHKLAQRDQDRGPLGQRDLFPAVEGGPGRGHGRFHLGRGGEVDVPGDLPGGRVVDLPLALGGAVPRLAADPVGDVLGGLGPSRCHCASSLTAFRASVKMVRPSRASGSLSVSGGAMSSVLPYRPPLPISSPRSRVASSMRAASGALAWPVFGSTMSRANIRPLPRTSPAAGLAAAASRRAGMMISPSRLAVPCAPWESA